MCRGPGDALPRVPVGGGPSTRISPSACLLPADQLRLSSSVSARRTGRDGSIGAHWSPAISAVSHTPVWGRDAARFSGALHAEMPCHHPEVDLPGWVLTCDPGVDDAIALAVAAGLAERQVAAIVAGAGNVAASTAWRNAAGMAAHLGLDVPVGIGSERTIAGTSLHRPGEVHGVDGLLGLADRLPAPAPAARPPDGLPLVRGDVIALGPLTDIARALHAGQAVDRVVWMGGSTGGGTAEFNGSADPEAVDAVLGSAADVTVVPIEITRQVDLGGDDLARWSAGSAIGRLCAELAARRRRPGAPGVTVHDAVAVIAAFDPDRFDWTRRRLTATAHGRGPAGCLTTLPGRPNARVAAAVDAEAVRRRIVDAVASA